MKTNLTAEDLRFIHQICVFELRIANSDPNYKRNIENLVIKIQQALTKIRVEIKG